MADTLTIKINDTLQPNTTYNFNFGQSIEDNNEGNPFNQFKYVLCIYIERTCAKWF